MQTILHIPSISCHHCLHSIRRELSYVNGVEYVDGDVKAKTVVVTFTDEAALDQARAALAEAGYAPTN